MLPTGIQSTETSCMYATCRTTQQSLVLLNDPDSNPLHQITCNANRNNAKKSLNISINGEDISNVTSTKYLGVIIDKNLTWNEHVDYVSSKVRGKTAAIKHLGPTH